MFEFIGYIALIVVRLFLTRYIKRVEIIVEKVIKFIRDNVLVDIVKVVIIVKKTD